MLMWFQPTLPTGYDTPITTTESKLFYFLLAGYMIKTVDLKPGQTDSQFSLDVEWLNDTLVGFVWVKQCEGVESELID